MENGLVLNLIPFQLLTYSHMGCNSAGSLYREASSVTVDAGGEYGIAVMQKFCDNLSQALREGPSESDSYTREASLLLRAELSVRVYFCALLQVAARWIGDKQLCEEAYTYYNSLEHMEAARNILIKNVLFPTGIHATYPQLPEIVACC